MISYCISPSPTREFGGRLGILPNLDARAPRSALHTPRSILHARAPSSRIKISVFCEFVDFHITIGDH